MEAEMQGVERGKETPRLVDPRVVVCRNREEPDKGCKETGDLDGRNEDVSVGVPVKE